jgi:hypothetical protein
VRKAAGEFISTASGSDGQIGADADLAVPDFELIEALQLYESIQEPYAIGMSHRRLERIAKINAAHQHRVVTVRIVQQSMRWDDFIHEFDVEFPGAA